MKASWEAHQGREKVQEGPTPEQEQEAPQDFAAGIDSDALSDRAAALREGREAEERHTAQKAAKEQERTRELERQQEIEREAHRDRVVRKKLIFDLRCMSISYK
ncbi:hypothetical protein GLP59_17360 [Sulfitobacter sp. M220]|uniref:hypothetical protein n=1 Tax=Sulfitobacter sp. M220 TaxID=2675333 RepID=UPI001F2CE293|nr:hypothetical protein [Sulfitobacter sp. M220]MCF7779377.1 hypothetical protein [Sulfitobacter sp. M220]